MDLQTVFHYLTAAAIVIGYVVMCAWVVLIVWLISIVIGEFRFNRLLKRRSRREFDDPRSSRNNEMSQWDEYMPGDGYDYPHNTAELPLDFQFHSREDDIDTDTTGSVFDIRERYPNEFA